MSERGLLVVLEGGEGVGKTTQWQRIGDSLERAGGELVRVREPGGTEVGNAIRHILLDAPHTMNERTEAMLFAASRAEIIAAVVQPALARGAVVLLDRFLLSTYAYQGAGRGIDMTALRSINAVATRGVTPDITLLLTLPLDAAMARASSRSAADRIEREDRAFHTRVAGAFARATSAAWQAEHPECGEIVAIDADGSVDDVTARCIDALAAKWPARFGTMGQRDTPAAPPATSATPLASNIVIPA